MCTKRFIVVLSGYISIISTITITNVQSANILFLLPVPSASHRLWNNVLIEGLEERGHNLTVLTVEMERSRQNVTYICMKNVYESLHEFDNDKNGYFLWNSERKSSLSVIKERYKYANFVSRKVFESKEIHHLLSYPKNFKFEAVIFDYSMATSMLAILEYFDYPPLISVSPESHPLRLSAASSAQLVPSYMPHFSMQTTSEELRENIAKRFLNGLIYQAFDWFYAKFIYMRNENMRILHFSDFWKKNILNLEQLEYSDLILVNKNFYFDNVMNLPPNAIPVGGIQAQRLIEIPNDDVVSYMKYSKKPIILFTMGSSMLAEDLGYVIMHEIMDAFGKLDDFNIICKCNEKFIRKASKPQNVLFVKWMQQNWILENPKLHLVITHGGMLTIQEAIWHSKLILGLPVQIEHERNINRAKELGIAESIDIHNFTATEIAIKVRMLLENPIYQVNVQKASEIMRNLSPLKPKELAVFWIEQAIKYKGLKHLQSEGRTLSFYKLYMIDIISIILVIMLIYILIMQYHIIKAWLSRRTNNRSNKAEVHEDVVKNGEDKLKNE